MSDRLGLQTLTVIKYLEWSGGRTIHTGSIFIMIYCTKQLGRKESDNMTQQTWEDKFQSLPLSWNLISTSWPRYLYQRWNPKHSCYYLYLLLSMRRFPSLPNTFALRQRQNRFHFQSAPCTAAVPLDQSKCLAVPTFVANAKPSATKQHWLIGPAYARLRIHEFHKVPPPLSNHHVLRLSTLFHGASAVQHRPEYVAADKRAVVSWPELQPCNKCVNTLCRFLLKLI